MTTTQRLFDVMRSRQGAVTNVYGRDHELVAIQEAFDRVSETDCPSSELVLIHGPSGCGKSSLVKALTEWIAQECDDENVMFGSGKYDQFMNNQPFAGIVDASNELCKSLNTAESMMIKRFNDRLQNMVDCDQDLLLLKNTIKDLAAVFTVKGENQRNDSSVEEHFNSLSQALTRFKQIWRYFLLAMSVCSDVTVIFLDDVQWADSDSLDLINTLTKVTQARNILLICAYRDDATVEKAQLERLQWCFALQQTSANRESSNRRRLSSGDYSQLTVPMTEVSLGHLDCENTIKLVCGLLNDGSIASTNLEERTDVRELGEVIFSHTKGNPFFIVHYLNYLSSAGLIKSNDDGQSWEWDLFLIEHQEFIPESIAELLSRVIETLSDYVVSTLTIGAHAGFQFSSDLLEQPFLFPPVPEDKPALASSRPNSHRPLRRKLSDCRALCRNQIQPALEEAIKCGLVERCGKLTYAFTHDQIQRAFYMTLADKPSEQELLHLNIGRALLEMVEDKQETTMEASMSTAFTVDTLDGTMFVAVDNLNKGSVCLEDVTDRKQLITLNYDAARAALRKSSTEAAARYTRSALALLDDTWWESEYELTLDLYALAARLEHCSGRDKDCKLLLSEIQSRARSVLDKLPSYFTEIDSLAAAGKLMDSLKLGMKVLRHLGEPMRLRPTVFHLVAELGKASRAIKATNFRDLRLMENPSKVAAMSVLLSITTGACQSVETRILAATIFLRMVRISCAHGLSTLTPFGIAGYSTIQVNLGDWNGAKASAELALELSETIPGAQATLGCTSQLVYAMVFPWTGRSLEKLHPEYLRAYHTCMAHGDVDSGFFGILHHVVSSILRGTELGILHLEFNKYLEEIDEFGLENVKRLVVAYWQPVRMLLGMDPVRTCPTDLLDVTGLYGSVHANYNDAAQYSDKISLCFGKLMLGRFGGETVVEDFRTCCRIGKLNEYAFTHINRSMGHLVHCLGVFELLRQTKKRKYRHHARNAVRKMKKFFDKVAQNAHAPFKLVQAESLCANQRWRNSAEDIHSVEQAYLGAASAACSTGYLPCEAYSYERLAIVMKGRGDPDQRASVYMAKAKELYTKWGANAKLQLIAFP